MRKTLGWTLVAMVGLTALTVTPARAQDTAGAPEVVVPAPVPTDSRPVTGNFDGIGRDTVFWYSTDSVDRRWQGKTDRTFAEMEPSEAAAGFKPFTGDFNGDRRSDIFFYGPGAAGDVIWYGRADNTYQRVEVAAPGSYLAALPGDFNGDGRTDIVFYKPGSTVMWRSMAPVNSTEPPTGTFTVTPLQVTNSYTPFVGDFNGDRRADIFWYKGGSTADHIWYGRSDFTFTGVQLTVAGHYVPVPGDYDGNGRTDVLWYVDGGEQDYVWWATSAGFTSQKITVNGSYKPFVGDFDGDRRSDIFWWGPAEESDRTWFGQANRVFKLGPAISA